MPYATPTECKDFSLLASIKALSDPVLTALIARAERLINTHTHNDFNPFAGATELLDGAGSRRLQLEKRIEALSEVTFLTPNGSDEVLSAQELSEIEFYEWHLAANLTFPAGRKNIKLVGDFGYSAVPPEVKDATCLTVESLALVGKNSEARSGALKKERIGDYSYELSDNLKGSSSNLSKAVIPTEARMLLVPFKRPLTPRTTKKNDFRGRFGGRTHFFGGDNGH